MGNRFYLVGVVALFRGNQITRITFKVDYSAALACRRIGTSARVAQDLWRARCIERRPSGSENDLGKRAGRKIGTASQADFTDSRLPAVIGFIDEHKESFGVEPICRELQVAPSTYYAVHGRPPSARAGRDE